jgi:Protein of unknown function (DUF3618)
VAGGERNADDIQRDIEQARAGLAESVDQLAHRTSPKRLADNAKQSLRDRANTTQGRIVLGVTGGLALLLIVRRVRKH